MTVEVELHNLAPALDRAIAEAVEGVSHSALSPRGREPRSHRRVAVVALAVAASIAAAVGLVARLDSLGGHGGVRPRTTTSVSSSTVVPTSTAPTTSPSTSPTTTKVPATSPTTQAGVALRSVDWPSVVYPINPHCRGLHPPVTVIMVDYPVPASGVQLAAVLVRCNAGAGTPPSALYVYDGATSTQSPHLLQTLVSDADGWQSGTFGGTRPLNENGASISLAVAGTSSTSVPNCCPDVRTTLVWNWTGSRYQLGSSVPPHVTYPARP